VTGESLGLLIEEARTNLISNSITLGNIGEKPTSLDFANLVVGQSAVVSEDILDVDGNGKCIKHTRGVGGDNNLGYYTSGGMSSLTIGQTYAFSIYVYIPSSQKNKITSIRFGPDSGFSSVTFGFADLNILDKWQRVVGSFVTSTTINTQLCRVTAENGTFFYTDAWQMEVGSFPTSYIPTVASTRTRAADNASITGKNFSSFYRQDEGTVYADIVISRWGSVAFPRLVSIHGSNANDANEFSIYTRYVGGVGDYGMFGVISDGVGTGDFNPPAGTTTGSGRVALSGKQNDAVLVVNGLTTPTDNTVNMPTSATQLLLFSAARFQIKTSGYLRRLTYYPKRLTNAQLQALTK
jgi:hypothetical protein